MNRYFQTQVKKHIEAEGYAERWNATDAQVRGYVSVDEYVESVRVTTLKEWWALRPVVAAARDSEPEHLRKTPYRILVFGRGEGGAPHTHGPFIMLPHATLHRITPATLVHEKMHVYQRHHPIETVARIAQTYPITGFEYPEQNMRANPDTSRILFGDMRPVYKLDAAALTDIQDPRDHPYEIEAYKGQNGAS
jgi:hypothetical protein